MKAARTLFPMTPLGVFILTLTLLTAAVFGKAHVFLLAGQSNMSGAGLFDELRTSQKKPPQGVQIWNKGQWQELAPGIAANAGRFGPEFAFGRAMKKAFPDDEIYLIKVAAGGTSMHKHWHVDEGGGPLLKMFLSRARAALNDLDDNRVKYSLDGMLWMQGESDADQGKGAEYEESLRDFIAAMRKEFGERKMPFVMGRILPTFDKPKGHGPMVRKAQETIAEEMENVAVFDTDDFPRINKGHYNHEGQIDLGNAFAEHLLKMKEADKH